MDRTKKILIAIIAALLVTILYLVLTTDRYYYFKTGKQTETSIPRGAY